MPAQHDQGVPVDATAVIALLQQQIGALSVDVAVQTARAMHAETELTRLLADLPDANQVGGSTP
jgi:hypothetical protein